MAATPSKRLTGRPSKTAKFTSSKPRIAPARPAQEQVRFDDITSGRYDEVAQVVEQEALLDKRILLPDPEQPKLHKVLAQSGLGSRLDMEQLIKDNEVSINGTPAHVGQRVQFGDKVRVRGRLISLRITPPAPRVLAYHKPVGEVVTLEDPQNRPTVFRNLPKLPHGKWQSVGRLDLNTEGLLLFSSSGELANKLMHPRFGLEREYAVRVLGALSKDERQKLLDGVTLEDGLAQFRSIEEGGGEGANCWYRVTIAEGRNREVRRMFEAVGHAVSRLIRIRYGAMTLPKGLRRGHWLELAAGDLAALAGAAGMELGRRATVRSKVGIDAQARALEGLRIDPGQKPRERVGNNPNNPNPRRDRRAPGPRPRGAKPSAV